MGENLLQRWIMELLRPLIDRWLRSRGSIALVGADQFVYYRPHSPIDRVAPDIYVLPGVAPDGAVTSWKTWETGIVPSFALEIVSKDWEKDYAETPERYATAGVPELVIFDPTASQHPERAVWQVFRRTGHRPLTRIEVSQGDRIRSEALDCYLRAVGERDAVRIRIGTGPRGDDLFPTAEEAERAGREAERTGREAERAGREAERIAREAAESAATAERAAREAAVATAEAERAAREAAHATAEAALKRVAELEAELKRR